MANGLLGPDEAFPGQDITGIAPTMGTTPTISMNDFSFTQPMSVGPDEAFTGRDNTGVAPTVGPVPSITVNDPSVFGPMATISNTPFGTVNTPSLANMGISVLGGLVAPGLSIGKGVFSLNPISFVANLIADQIFGPEDAQTTDESLGGLLGGQVAPVDQPAIGPEFGLVSAPQTDVTVSAIGDVGDFGGMSAADAAGIGMGADAGW